MSTFRLGDSLIHEAHSTGHPSPYTGLQKLDLNKNDLQRLADNFGQLRKLECLYAQHNGIVEMPSFLGCANLKEILMANNAVSELSADFCDQLPQLQILDLRDNKIERLPDEIDQLQALVRLDLSNNSINTVPNSLAALAHLCSLQLDGNPIRSIRRDILQSGTVRVMNLLRERAGGVVRAKADEPERCADGESIAYLERFNMRKSKALSLAGKGLSTVADDVFMVAQEECVQRIDLSKNRLQEVPDG